MLFVTVFALSVIGSHAGTQPEPFLTADLETPYTVELRWKVPAELSYSLAFKEDRAPWMQLELSPESQRKGSLYFARKDPCKNYEFVLNIFNGDAKYGSVTTRASPMVPRIHQPPRPRVVSQEFSASNNLINVFVEWDTPELAQWDLSDINVGSHLHLIQGCLASNTGGGSMLGGSPPVQLLSAQTAKISFPAATLNSGACHAAFILNSFGTKCGKAVNMMGPFDTTQMMVPLTLSCDTIPNLPCPRREQPRRTPLLTCQPQHINMQYIAPSSSLAGNWIFPQTPFKLNNYSVRITRRPKQFSTVVVQSNNPPNSKIIALPVKEITDMANFQGIHELAILHFTEPMFKLPVGYNELLHFEYHIQVCGMEAPVADNKIAWNIMPWYAFTMNPQPQKPIPPPVKSEVIDRPVFIVDDIPLPPGVNLKPFIQIEPEEIVQEVVELASKPSMEPQPPSVDIALPSPISKEPIVLGKSAEHMAAEIKHLMNRLNEIRSGEKPMNNVEHHHYNMVDRMHRQMRMETWDWKFIAFGILLATVVNAMILVGSCMFYAKAKRLREETRQYQAAWNPVIYSMPDQVKKDADIIKTKPVS